MGINDILSNVYKLPEQSKHKILRHISEERYVKGTCLIEASKIASKTYFIKKGIVRAYANSGDNDVTFWFGTEGEPVVSMKSYVDEKPGYENVELLEDCDVYVLETKILKQLFCEDIHIANWGRKFAERELVKTEELFISRQYKTALERYQDLIKTKPYLLKRVQLGYIASYLGITQVTLSRIRSEIK